MNTTIIFSVSILLWRAAFSQVCNPVCQNLAGCTDAGFCECTEQWLGLDCSIASQNSHAFDEGNYIFSWAFEPVGGVDYVYIQLKVKTTGWVGFMVGSDDMVDGDVFMGNITTGVPLITDRWSSHSGTPPDYDTDRNGSDDLEDKSGWTMNDGSSDWTILSFRRKTDTGDNNDFIIDNTDQAMPVGWAYNRATGDLDPAVQHTSVAAGSLNFNLGIADESAASLKDMAGHGVVMIISWGIVACAGAFIAYSARKETGLPTNFFKQEGMHRQGKIHKILQSCAVAGVLLGVVLGFAFGHDLLRDGTPKLHIAHGVFGVILTIAIVAQAGMNILCKSDLVRAIHSTLGKILLAVALLWQIPTGTLMLWGPSVAGLFWIGLPGFWVVAVFIKHRKSTNYAFVRRHELEKESDERYRL